MPSTSPSSDSSYEYVGTELDVFAGAKNWKSYFAAQICPYISGCVLEVGAGLGSTAQVLGERKLSDEDVTHWTCLEPDGSLAERLKAAAESDPILKQMPIELIVGTVADLPDEETYDTLLYIDVLEHIEEDAAELREAAKRLRPGGHIIVLSPAHQWLFSKFDESIGHCRRYTRAMLRKVGPDTCELVQERYFDSVGMLASLANRVLLKQSMPDVKQIQFWDGLLVPISRTIDGLLGYHIGKTVVTIWQKPHTTALTGTQQDPAATRIFQIWNRFAMTALSVAVAVVLYFLVAFMGYAQPVFDDYHRAATVADIGVLESVKLEYHSWAGRWLGTGLSYVLGNTSDITQGYSIKLFVIGFICLFALVCFLRTMLPKALSLFQVIALSLVGVAIFWSGMPAPGETFYWLTGALENQLSVAMILLAVAAIVTVFPDGTERLSTPQFVALAVLCLCSFIIPGFHELFGCVWMCVLSFGLVAAFARKSSTSIKTVWSLLLLCGLLGLYVVVSAPGNAVRIEHQQHQPNVKIAVTLTAKQIFLVLREWISDPRLLAASFALCVMPFRKYLRQNWSQRETRLWRFGFPLLGLIIFTGCLFGGAFARGKFLGDRPLNGVYALYLLFWFGTIYVWRASTESEARQAPLSLGFAICLLSFTLALSGRMANGVISDLRNAPAYAAQARDRYQRAREQAKQGELDLSLKPFEIKPRIYKTIDLTADPSAEPNEAFARYFGLDSVTVIASKQK